MPKTGKSGTRYPDKMKLEALTRVRAGETVAVVAKELHFHPTSYSKWVKDPRLLDLLHNNGTSNHHKETAAKKPQVKVDNLELENLRIENRVLKAENAKVKIAFANLALDLEITS